MAVQQHVLNWLYSVLTSEYHDVNRTYNDVARVLIRFPTLAPRTDVHTLPDGMSALLLHVSGTIPVIFRGTTYRFPLSIWIPHAYPREPPLVYVTPTEAMVVRPGQHVDPQGQVYHPYLASWPEFWDKSTIEDFISVLSDVFSKEPPVVSRRLTRPVQSLQTAPIPPPAPLLPPKTMSRPPDSDTVLRPPLPPPKPNQNVGVITSGSSTRPDEPAPSLTPEITTTPTAAAPPSRYDTAPPLPVRSHRLGLQDIDLYQSHPQPQSQAEILPYDHDQTGFVPVALPAVIRSPNDQPNKSHHMPTTYSPTGPSQSSEPVYNRWNQEAMTVKRQPRLAPASPNILDEPVMLENERRAVIVAPPPPPNPEKDALLRQLAQTLASKRLLSRQQNESRMEGVRAQRAAMQSAVSALQSEMSQLTQLSNVLNSNADILRDTLRKADLVIEGSKNHPSPEIDELLVASTVVSNQLYALVAEERALGDAIFMLGRAVERGRVTPAVFAKMTRSLAREWYLKKALVRRIGQGIGLAL